MVHLCCRTSFTVWCHLINCILPDLLNRCPTTELQSKDSTCAVAVPIPVSFFYCFVTRHDRESERARGDEIGPLPISPFARRIETSGHEAEFFSSSNEYELIKHVLWVLFGWLQKRTILWDYWRSNFWKINRLRRKNQREIYREQRGCLYLSLSHIKTLIKHGFLFFYRHELVFQRGFNAHVFLLQGGGVMGASGRNAARVVIRDHRKR